MQFCQAQVPPWCLRQGCFICDFEKILIIFSFYGILLIETEAGWSFTPVSSSVLLCFSLLLDYSFLPCYYEFQLKAPIDKRLKCRLSMRRCGFALNLPHTSSSLVELDFIFSIYLIFIFSSLTINHRCSDNRKSPPL